jgi:hypothetical protein
MQAMGLGDSRKSSENMTMNRLTFPLVFVVSIFNLTALACGAKADVAPVTSFWGLSLGQPELQVKLSKGWQNGTIMGPCRGAAYDPAPYTQTLAYPDDGGVYYVDLRDGKIWSVVFYAKDGVAPSFPIGAVGDSQSALEAKLGVPSLVSDSKDKTARWVSFEKYSVAYQLRDDKVVMFGIYDPAQGPIQFCD